MSSFRRIVTWLVGLSATLATIGFFAILLSIGHVGRNVGVNAVDTMQARHATDGAEPGTIRTDARLVTLR